MKSKAGTIVVAVDGSESSLRAATWAARRAVAERRDLTLAHAIHAVTPAFVDAAIVYPEGAQKILHAEGHQVVHATRVAMHKSVPELSAHDITIHELVEFLDPREMLLELSQDALMLVMGSRGRGPVRSLLLGSVSVALVRHSHCPVIVHRPMTPEVPVTPRVVVGIDTSESSRSVLEFAYREASLQDLPLTVLHCYWDIQAGTMAGGMFYESVADVEGEQLAVSEAMAGMSEKYPDVDVTVHNARGLPHDLLARNSEGSSLVVVGARQAGRIAQALSGSVSVALVERVSCPVAVVPLPRRG